MLFNHQKGPTPQFATLTVFTTALCNLNCSYCYICKDKNGGLKQIDDDIKAMFDNGEYITQTLDLDPNCKNSINQISLWGGEPFLGIYRFIDHLDEFFTAFPNINCIDVSSNWALPDHVKRIQDFINAIDKNYHLLNMPPDQRFHVMIQISIDGPEEMTDFGRGKGTTQKIYQNWKKLLDSLEFNENRFQVSIFTKATFSRSSWQFVNTPEKAYNWCKSMEDNLYIPWRQSNSKVEYTHSLWNNAQPTEWTSEDGKEYAKVTKAFFEASDRICEDMEGFRDVPSLIPEATLSVQKTILENKCNFNNFLQNLKCKKCGGGCGVFSYNLVPIPHGKFTMCHRGLFDAYTDYFNNLSRQEHLNDLAKLWSTLNPKYWIFDKKSILQIQNTINKMYEYEHQIFFTDLAQQIKCYADSGVIDPKYSDMNNILPTLGYFLSEAQCIQDNFMFGGSWVTKSPLEIPLMYNGTMDIVLEEIHKQIQERKPTIYVDRESLQ